MILCRRYGHDTVHHTKNLVKIKCIYSELQEYKKRLLLRSIRHFKSDLIINVDHIHISGTEPSSVILS